MSDNSLTITKNLSATPEAVFDAWTTPEHMAKWLSPMTSATIPKLELKVGGEYQIDMHGDEKHYVHVGKYLEIDRPNKLVFTWISDGTNQKETIVTLTMVPEGNGTLLTLTHEHLDTVENRDNHNQGWTAILEKLATVLSFTADTAP